MKTILICILIGYVFGMFLTAFFVARAYTGKDISEIGTGNPGMANVMARVGKVPGLIVLAGDILKTVLAMGICKYLFYDDIGSAAGLFAGFGALLGHNFPVWRKFKGGKGVAVTCAWIILYMPFGGIVSAVAGGIITVLTGLLPLGAVLITVFEIPFAFAEKGWTATGVMTLSFLIMLYRNFPGFIRGFKNEENREFKREKHIKNSIGTVLVILAVCGLLFFDLVRADGGDKTFFEPSVERADISEYTKVTSMEELSDEDLEVIFRQTGVAKAGVESLIDLKKMYLLSTIQEHFFLVPEIEDIPLQMVRHLERVTDHKGKKTVFVVEEGDIIVTLSSYCGGWRYGHAGLVLDAKTGDVLEAMTYGEPSCIENIGHWSEYPAYVIVRPQNLSKEERAEVANYAKENLTGIDYALLASKTQKNIKLTNCSLVIWQAYKEAGINIDSDGGYFVSPEDIMHDDDLELVMEYGCDF